MLIWFAFAVLSAVILFLVLKPLLVQSNNGLQSQHSADTAVYRDQLAEVDGDLSRGVIDHAEAEAARIEISRKLLHAADENDDNPDATLDEIAGRTRESSGRDGQRYAPAAVALSLVIPTAAVGSYLLLGSPNLPDQPHDVRMQEDLSTATVGGLLARVEERLQTHPEDGRGWELIAPIYFRAGRFHDAADAYRNAIRLLGETNDRMVEYVSAALIANNGIVSDEMRTIARRIQEKAPDRPEARFWLALALEQDGEVEAAKAAYRALLDSGKEEDSWRSMVQRRLDKLAANSDKAAPSATP